MSRRERAAPLAACLLAVACAVASPDASASSCAEPLVDGDDTFSTHVVIGDAFHVAGPAFDEHEVEHAPPGGAWIVRDEPCCRSMQLLRETADGACADRGASPPVVEDGVGYRILAVPDDAVPGDAIVDCEVIRTVELGAGREDVCACQVLVVDDAPARPLDGAPTLAAHRAPDEDVSLNGCGVTPLDRRERAVATVVLELTQVSDVDDVYLQAWLVPRGVPVPDGAPPHVLATRLSDVVDEGRVADVAIAAVGPTDAVFRLVRTTDGAVGDLQRVDVTTPLPSACASSTMSPDRPSSAAAVSCVVLAVACVRRRRPSP